MGNLSKYRGVIINGQCHPSLYVVLEPTALSARIVATEGNLESAKACAAGLEHCAIVYDSLLVWSK